MNTIFAREGGSLHYYSTGVQTRGLSELALLLDIDLVEHAAVGELRLLGRRDPAENI